MLLPKPSARTIATRRLFPVSFAVSLALSFGVGACAIEGRVREGPSDISALRDQLRLASTDARPDGEERKPRLLLEIATPGPGETVGGPAGATFVGGGVLAPFTRAPRTNLLLLIDRSEATASRSSVAGRASSGLLRRLFAPARRAPDSILEAELLAARALLANLDPRQTRVALAAFAGDRDPKTPDAELIVPLTVDYERVLAGLRELSRQGSQGGTNTNAGLNVAALEILRARARARALGVIVLMTAGLPTLPTEASTFQNTRLTAITAERAAAKRATRIHVLAFSKDGERDEPLAAFAGEIARAGRGKPVVDPDPREPTIPLPAAGFSDIEALEVRNVTTGGAALRVEVAEDGSYGAMVDARAGDNTIEVYARSSDGLEKRVSRTFTFVPGATPPEVDDALDAIRERARARAARERNARPPKRGAESPRREGAGVRPQ